jgi:hypothetical protein
MNASLSRFWRSSSRVSAIRTASVLLTPVREASCSASWMTSSLRMLSGMTVPV